MNPTNLDMDLLRTFVTGVRLGNFSKAADKVGRSQSAVSLQLRRLERQVGARLFHRDGRGLALTESGRNFLGYAERILDLNDEALEATTRREAAGEIRLGIPPDLAETWLPHMIGRFSRSHPGVMMEARVDRNAALLEDIAAGRLDIAFIWDRNPATTPANSEHIVELPIVWIGAAALPPREDEILPLVVMGEPCLFRAHGLARLQEARRVWRVAFTSSSLAGLWAATSAGLGVTVRTTLGLPKGLAALNQPGLPALGTVSLRGCLAENPSPTVKRFAALLMQTIREAL